MDPVIKRKIKEATYLTAEKAWIYRPILRYFYIQHERMREFLFPEEILDYLRQQEEFEDYTLEMVQQDLESLTKWGNLIASQDHRKAKTIDEYKKKNARYQCTPYTVEFERMMVHLEQMGDTFRGSLEKTQFERLYQVLLKIEKANHQSADESAQLWADAMTYFRQITQNTSDYIAYIHSEKVAEKMKTEAFLVYKDRFTVYLRDFIVGLQRTSNQIQELLTEFPDESLRLFFEKVIRHQQQTVRIEEEKRDTLTEQLEKWRSIKDWFLGSAYGESEFERLQERTNEAIRRITRVVQRMSERHQQFRSRRRDYEHLAKWFERLDSIEEAHELSSVVFGIFHTKHFVGDAGPTDDLYTDIWEEQPIEHIVNERAEPTRNANKTIAIIDRRAEIEAVQREHLLRLDQQRQIIEQYMDEKWLRIKQLPVIEPFIRKLLLNWVGKAMLHEDHLVQTEFGTTVRVTIQQERVILRSTDGDLEMPDVHYEFLEKRGEADATR